MILSTAAVSLPAAILGNSVTLFLIKFFDYLEGDKGSLPNVSSLLYLVRPLRFGLMSKITFLVVMSYSCFSYDVIDLLSAIFVYR